MQKSNAQEIGYPTPKNDRRSRRSSLAQKELTDQGGNATPGTLARKASEKDFSEARTPILPNWRTQPTLSKQAIHIKPCKAHHLGKIRQAKNKKGNDSPEESPRRPEATPRPSVQRGVRSLGPTGTHPHATRNMHRLLTAAAWLQGLLLVLAAPKCCPRGPPRSRCPGLHSSWTAI